MREQRLGMYLPVLILVLIEVILMSHGGEGMSTFQKRITGSATKLSPARYEWQRESKVKKIAHARGKTARINRRRPERSVSENLRVNCSDITTILDHQTWLHCIEAANGGGQESVPWSVSLLKPSSPLIPSYQKIIDLLLQDSSEENSDSQSFDKTDPYFQEDESWPELDSQSLDIKPGFILSQIFKLLGSKFNNIFNQPSSTDLEANSSVFSLSYLRSLIKLLTSLISQEDNNSVQTQSDWKSVAITIFQAIFQYIVNTVLTIVCRLVQNIINCISNPYTSVFNLTLTLALGFIASINSPHKVTDGWESGGLFPAGSIMNHFNLFQTTIESPPQITDTKLNPIQSIVDYINPFQSPPERPERFSPFNSLRLNVTKPIAAVRQTINELLTPIELLLNYLNIIPAPDADQQDPPKPNLFQSVVNFFNPFQSATEKPEPFSPFDRLRQNVAKPITAVQQAINELLTRVELLLNYLNIIPPDADKQDPAKSNVFQSVVNFFNPFQSATEKPEPFSPFDRLRQNVAKPITAVQQAINELLTRVELLLNYLNIIPPEADKQDPPKSNVFQSVVNFLNPFQSATEKPEPSSLFKRLRINVAKPDPDPPEQNLLRTIVDFFNPFKPVEPATDPQEPGNLLTKLLSLIGLVLDFYNFLKYEEPPQPDNEQPGYIQSIINYLNPFKSADSSQKPKPDYSRPSNSTLELITDLLKIFDSNQANIEKIKKPNEEQHRPDVARSHGILWWNPLRRRTRSANSCLNIPSDYHQVKGTSRAYKLHTSHLSWNDAKLKCTSEGAELALPEDQPQYDLIINYAKSTVHKTDLHFHAGFHRQYSGGSWASISGDPLHFEKWAHGIRDDDRTDRQCGGILVHENDTDGFTSEVCTVPLPFICEIRISPECA